MSDIKILAGLVVMIAMFGGLVSSDQAGAGAAPACAPTSYKIFFGRDLSNMTSSATAVADEGVRILAGCSAAHIAVTGHSDGAEASGSHPDVSLARANTVRDYLIAHGAPAAVVAVEDAGFSAPMVPTGPSDSEPLNRSVSVDIQ